MTPDDIKLLKSSFKLVEPIAAQAAELFYQRLFAVAPSVQPLFQQNMDTQGRMLMTTIGLVVRNLDHPEKITPMIHKLGQRHNAYGAQAAHYPVVGEVLLWTLAQGLGAQFTPAHHKAWSQAYALLSSLMMDAQGIGGKAAAA